MSKKELFFILFVLPVMLAALVFLVSSISSHSRNEKGPFKTLKLAHNLSNKHPFHLSIQKFASKVKEKSEGTLELVLYPAAVLGSDRGLMEQLQEGVVDMIKISSSSLESFNSLFSLFSLPYLFRSKEHFNLVLARTILDEINEITQQRDHFRILSYFSTGIRSFYTRDRPILKPSQLKGMRIRVMESQTSIKMLKLLGGTPTPMPYGEIYSALQQGVIDGAENNLTALTLGKQGEVAKFYSFDEHVQMPDFLIINHDTWLKRLTEKERGLLSDCAKEATEEYRMTLDRAMELAMEKAKNNMGVHFYYPDREAFKEKVKPLFLEFERIPLQAKLLKKISRI